MTYPKKSRWRSAASVLAVVLVGGMVTAACGGGGGGGTSASPPPPPPPPPPAPPPSSVEISGQVTFDRVPFQSDNTGLNYNAITQDPARGVIVQAVDNGGTVLASDVTDASGNYAVTVDASTDVRIQVRSQMEQTTGATWDIQVVDNTSSNAIYILAGSLTDSGTANSTRNLNAASGWGGTSYTTTRAAGPFAILDDMYEAVTGAAAIDSSVVFPDLQVLWSVNNRDVDGDIANGEIGTSSYTRLDDGSGTPNVPTILILGDENSDTDEYDQHVIIHEFGHYFEDQVSRSNSIGGGHSLSDHLDPRLAQSEGWANAYSAIVLDDPNYRDSLGNQQLNGFTFSVENDLTDAAGPRFPGWYSETSIQQVLYDVFDSVNDGNDTISAGFGPIYAAITSAAFTENRNFTTIFDYAEQFRAQSGIDATVLNQLLSDENINGTGERGSGETNDAGLAQVLPVYKTATVGGPAVTVCSTDNFASTTGGGNKLGVYDFVSLTLNSSQAITITVSKTSGPATTNPNFRIWIENQFIVSPAISSSTDMATWSGILSAGTYAIDVFEEGNTEENAQNDSCFSFTVS